MDKELIIYEDGRYIMAEEISQALAEFERMVADIKKQEEEIKQKILAEMETKGIIKIDTEDISISYSAPTVRESFDSKKLRADLPDLYDEYVTISPVKSSIRLKVK